MFKRSFSPFVIVALAVALSQSACTEASIDQDAEEAEAEVEVEGAVDEESIGEAESALTGNNLLWANACVSKIQSLRASIGLSKGKSLVSVATKEPAVSGATYGDCAWKEAKYDSTHGGHAAHNANLYHCLGTQNECVNWSPNAGETPTNMVKRCVQAWFDEGPGADYGKHGHYINMTSTQYPNPTCAVYKNAAGKYTITGDFKSNY